jgi:hypothetical protein
LEVIAGRIVFTTDTKKIDIHCVKNVSIVRRPVAWFDLLLGNAAFFLWVSLGCASFYTLDRPLGLVVTMIVINTVAVLMARRIKWVEVEYCDESGQVQLAYFSDGSSLGFGAGLGGTEEVYEALTVGLRKAEERVTEAPLPVADSSQRREPGWVVCEECGSSSFFQAQQRGRVQICPHCNAYMDA